MQAAGVKMAPGMEERRERKGAAIERRSEGYVSSRHSLQPAGGTTKTWLLSEKIITERPLHDALDLATGSAMLKPGRSTDATVIRANADNIGASKPGDLHVPLILSAAKHSNSWRGSTAFGSDQVVNSLHPNEKYSDAHNVQESAAAKPPPSSDVLAKKDPGDETGEPRSDSLHIEDHEYNIHVEEKRRPWYKQKNIWLIAILTLITIVFTALGIGFVVLGGRALVTVDGAEFQIWRLFFFIAALPIIWWFGDIATRFLVYGVERTMFTVKNALYFAYAVKKPATNVIRAALVLAWWAGIMTAGDDNMVEALSTTYNIILKIWACVTLFMTANLLKTLIAKILSLKFNKHSHLQKMHDSLRKEHMLHTLLQPREKQLQSNHGLYRGMRKIGKLFARNESGYKENIEPRPPVTVVQHHDSDDLAPTTAMQHQAPSQRSKPMWQKIRFIKGGKLDNGDRKVPEGHLSAIHITIQDENSLDTNLTVEGNTNLNCLQSKSQLPDHSVTGMAVKRIDSGKDGNGGAVAVRCSSLISKRSQSISRPSHVEHANQRAALDANVDKEEIRRVHAMASADIQAMNSFKSYASEDIAAEKLIKMEKYIRKNALQVRFEDELTQVERKEKVTTELEAKKLGFYLFWNVKADSNSRDITLDDLCDFLPEKNANRAFKWLDDNGDGCIDLQDCCAAVAKVYTDRENLAASLKDTKSVVGKLETVLGGVIHVLFFVIYLSIFNVNVMEFYLAFSSLVLAFSFIFSSSLRQMYENVVFLFVIHPFDIGDQMIVEDQFYFVDEINIQFTTFRSGMNGRVWYPNQRLMGQSFLNLSASGNKGELFKVLVDLDTPGSVLDEVKAAMEAHIKSNSTEFTNAIGVSFNVSENPMKMTLIVFYQFSHNGTDGVRAGIARNGMFILLSETLTRLGVRYTWPEVQHRYTMAGLPGSLRQEQAEAVLAANTGQYPPEADHLKKKFL